MIKTNKEIARDVEMSNLEDEDFRNKIWISQDELIKIIKYQKINEYGSLIEGLCKKEQDYLLRRLGVDE